MVKATSQPYSPIFSMKPSGYRKQTKVAIFASGNGSNAEAIIRYFEGHPTIRITLVLSNKPDAFVLTRAANHNIDTCTFDRSDFYSSDKILQLLIQKKIDWIVLAGFLWLIPENLLKAFNNRIVNIHPALLPKHGGKGMYGHKVHEAVIRSGEQESGITIHLLNEKYDEGPIIFQHSITLENDSPETLADKIHKLEHLYFAPVIEKLINESQ